MCSNYGPGVKKGFKLRYKAIFGKYGCNRCSYISQHIFIIESCLRLFITLQGKQSDLQVK